METKKLSPGELISQKNELLKQISIIDDKINSIFLDVKRQSLKQYVGRYYIKNNEIGDVKAYHTYDISTYGFLMVKEIDYNNRKSDYRISSNRVIGDSSYLNQMIEISENEYMIHYNNVINNIIKI
jgi:hypothetical protein